MISDPDRYSNDVDWDIVKALKKLGIGLIRDNSIERGPLKTISARRYLVDKIFKFNQTTAHQKNMYTALGSRYFPVDSKQYPPDTIRHWEANSLHSVARERLEENGWINSDGTIVDVDYFINKQGFRHDGTQIDYMDGREGGVIYLGDSHTMGVGIPIEDSWTYIAHHLCEKTKDLRYINMGCPGYGIDSYYRLLKRYIGNIKPNAVVISYPWQNTRTETFNVRKNCWEIQTISKSGRQRLKESRTSVSNVDLFHTAQSYIRWYKNLEAMKWLCHEQGTVLYAIEEEHQFDDGLQQITNEFVHQIEDDDLGRDLVHYGRKTHRHNGEVLNKVLNYIL
jgi:hypothetical protein